MMKKGTLFATTILFALTNCPFAFAAEPDTLTGLRKYEESLGNTVNWDAASRKISVYEENTLLYTTHLGSDTIQTELCSMRLPALVEADENGATYLPQETLDFIHAAQTPVKISDADGAYTIVSKQYEDPEKNILIHYPEIQNAKGELLQSYMNQSICQMVEKYAKSDLYESLALDYTITRSDEHYISILFTGTGKAVGISEPLKIMDSISLDFETSTVITAENFFTQTDALEAVLKDNTVRKLEYEALDFYLTEDAIVFYYKPLDDSMMRYDVIAVDWAQIQPLLRETVGERPAS